MVSDGGLSEARRMQVVQHLQLRMIELEEQCERHVRGSATELDAGRLYSTAQRMQQAAQAEQLRLELAWVLELLQ